MKILILPALLFYFACQCSYAQPGTLDPAFGTNGIVKTNIGTSGDYYTTGSAVVSEPDGGMYLVIRSNTWMEITKKFADGSTDTSYGHNGYSIPVLLPGAGYVYNMVAPHVALQSDGKLLVADVFSESFSVARFNTDGTLDKTFGLNGIAIAGDGQKNVATSIAVAANGNIIVAGYTYTDYNYDYFDPHFAILQFNTNGILENENISTIGGYTSVAIQTDGKIVAAGFLLDGYYSFSGYAVARYNTDLSIDTGFSGEGIGRPSGSGGSINSMLIQDNGKILVAGRTLVRYNTDGSQDSTFNGNGIVYPGAIINSIINQIDGKIIAAGDFFNIFRYNVDGSLDKTFSEDGHQSTAFGASEDYCYSIAVQTDGKLIALGSSRKHASPYSSFFAAARFNADGSPDNSFGSEGKLIGQVNRGNTSYNSTAVQSDGKLIAAGKTFNGSNWDFAIVRYNTDGSLDNTFSAGGIQVTDFDSTNDYANSIVIQSDGKILVGGSSAENFALARYNANGSPDSTFAGDGLQTDEFGPKGDINGIKKIALQIDGKIVAGGAGLARYNADGSLDGNFTRNSLNCYGFAVQNDGKIVATNKADGLSLYRYNTDGSPDKTFGEGGVVTIYDYGDASIYGSIALDNDGKIIVGGYLNLSAHEEDINYFAVLRFNSNGSVDNTFNKGELATYGSGRAYSIQVQHDHKILLGGVSFDSLDNRFALARYNANGSLDNTFNGGFFTTLVSPGSDEIADIAISGNKLYAVGYGQFPGNVGLVTRYFLAGETLLPPTVNLILPADNATYLSGANVYLKAIASDADGTISKVELYNGATLLYTATDTTYTFKWEHLLKGNYVLTAKATDNDGLVTVSDSVHISVVSNKPPTVSIISPANGQTFLTGATIHLQAAASDADGRVGKVEFYDGTTLLATEHKLPYTFDWKIGRSGNYNITAKATDNWGAVTTSAAINISVVDNQAPSVSIIAPSNEQIFIAPATFNLEAAASDADGKIVQISFYKGATLLTAAEHKAPYSYQWQNMPFGTYTITAVAKDNWGAETTSAPITVTVVPSREPSLSSWSSSADVKADLNAAIGVQLAPNPAVNILKIIATGLPKNNLSTITIMSPSGVLMKTLQKNSSMQTTHVNISSLKSGMYILKITSANRSIYRRFVKM